MIGLGSWQAYAAVAAAGLIAGMGGTWRVMSWKEAAGQTAAAKAEVKQAGKVVTQVQQQAARTQVQAQAHEAADQKIQVVYRTITKEIPTYVTPAIDRSFPVPVGALRVLDAAKLGVDVSAVPSPAGKPDDAASGLGLSLVVADVSDSYRACRQDDQQLADLQAAWTDALAHSPSPTK